MSPQVSGALPRLSGCPELQMTPNASRVSSRDSNSGRKLSGEAIPSSTRPRSSSRRTESESMSRTSISIPGQRLRKGLNTRGRIRVDTVGTQAMVKLPVSLRA